MEMWDYNMTFIITVDEKKLDLQQNEFSLWTYNF